LPTWPSPSVGTSVPPAVWYVMTDGLANGAPVYAAPLYAAPLYESDVTFCVWSGAGAVDVVVTVVGTAEYVSAGPAVVTGASRGFVNSTQQTAKSIAKNTHSPTTPPMTIPTMAPAPKPLLPPPPLFVVAVPPPPPVSPPPPVGAVGVAVVVVGVVGVAVGVVGVAVVVVGAEGVVVVVVGVPVVPLCPYDRRKDDVRSNKHNVTTNIERNGDRHCRGDDESVILSSLSDAMAASCWVVRL